MLELLLLVLLFKSCVALEEKQLSANPAAALMQFDIDLQPYVLCMCAVLLSAHPTSSWVPKRYIYTGPKRVAFCRIKAARCTKYFYFQVKCNIWCDKKKRKCYDTLGWFIYIYTVCVYIYILFCKIFLMVPKGTQNIEYCGFIICKMYIVHDLSN